MLEALTNDGNPVIRAILLSRQRYGIHLLAAFSLTTGLVGIWAFSVWMPSSPKASQTLKTVEYTHLPEPETIGGNHNVHALDHKLNPSVTMEESLLLPGGGVDSVTTPGIYHNIPGFWKPLKEADDDRPRPAVTVKVMHIIVGYDDKPLKYVLDDITVKTGLPFVYTGDYCCITLETRERAVHQLLMEILTPLDLQYVLSGRTIGIIPTQTKKPKGDGRSPFWSRGKST